MHELHPPATNPLMKIKWCSPKTILKTLNSLGQIVSREKKIQKDRHRYCVHAVIWKWKVWKVVLVCNIVIKRIFLISRRNFILIYRLDILTRYYNYFRVFVCSHRKTFRWSRLKHPWDVITNTCIYLCKCLFISV